MATSRRPLAQARELSMTTAQAQVRAGGLLKTVGSVKLRLAADHDPASYYRTRPALIVWDDFHSRVVAKANPTAAGTRFSVNVHELMHGATDTETEAALSGNHLYDESAACAVVAALIELIDKQPGGYGDLQNPSRSSVLYINSCVIRMGWRGGRRAWNVGAWGRGDSWWNAGYRVLSPGN